MNDQTPPTPAISPFKKVSPGVALFILSATALWSAIDTPPAEVPKCDDAATLKLVTELLEPEYSAVNGKVRITAVIDEGELKEGVNLCQVKTAVVANESGISQKIVSFMTYVDEDGTAIIQITN